MQILENFDPADVVERLIYHVASEKSHDKEILMARLISAIEKEYPLFHQAVIIYCLAKTKLRSLLGSSLAFKEWIGKNGDAFNSVAWNEEWGDIVKQYGADMTDMRLVVKLLF